MSYGCQIWGPYFLATAALQQTPWSNAADKVHLSFLRDMAGVGQGVSIEVMLRDFNRRPLANRWVKLACRWWTNLADMDATRVARMAWMSDILLMVEGCKFCWTYKLLSTLTALNVLPASSWDPEVNSDVTVDMVACLGFEEKDVVRAMDAAAASRWLGLHPCPRDAGEQGHEKSIHAGWIMPVCAVNAAALAVDANAAAPPSAAADADVAAPLGAAVDADAAAPPGAADAGIFAAADAAFAASAKPTAPPHTKLCLPFATLQCLAQFRLGWHHLESQMARQRRSQNGHARIPWNERWCKVCSVDRAPCEHARLASGAPRGAEDLRHFLLECPAYDAIRQHFADVFAVASVAANADACVAAIFSARPLAHQQRLAQCLVQMTEHRTSLGVRRRSRAAVQPAQLQQQAPPNPLQALDALDDELSALGIIAAGPR